MGLHDSLTYSLFYKYDAHNFLRELSAAADDDVDVDDVPFQLDLATKKYVFHLRRIENRILIQTHLRTRP